MDLEATRIRTLTIECCAVLDGCTQAGPARRGWSATTLEHLRAELLALAAYTSDGEACLDALGVVALVDEMLRATPVDELRWRAAS